MSAKPFDAALKDLIEADPHAWAELAAGRPLLAASLLDADVSTVSAAADKVFRLETTDGPFLLDLEVQSSWDGGLPDRLHLYGTLLAHRHGLPVQGVVLLLRPEANAAALTGERLCFLPGAKVPYDTYCYEIVRLWKQPLAPLMAGPLLTLPLAPLTDEAALRLESVVHEVEQRFQAEADPPLAAKLSTATAVLMGLRYSGSLIDGFYQGVTKMEDSSFYQLILRRGREQERPLEARRMIVVIGKAKLGDPDPVAQAALDAITDAAALEALGPRLWAVSSWKELLNLP